jgi:hypothetical protein
MHTSERALLRFMVRPIVTTVVCGLLLTAAGLIHRDFIHCSKLDPTHPIPASNYFEARGSPHGWLTSDNGTCGQLPGVPGRILWDALLYSAAFWIVFTGLAAWFLPRFVRSSRIPPLIVGAGVLLVWLIG